MIESASISRQRICGFDHLDDGLRGGSQQRGRVEVWKSGKAEKWKSEHRKKRVSLCRSSVHSAGFASKEWERPKNVHADSKGLAGESSFALRESVSFQRGCKMAFAKCVIRWNLRELAAHR
jgi:hypothetical protein